MKDCKRKTIIENKGRYNRLIKKGFGQYSCLITNLYKTSDEKCLFLSDKVITITEITLPNFLLENVLREN